MEHDVYVYISCLEDEQELPQVVMLRHWLIANGCTAIFDSTRYQGIAFKRYAAFVVVAGYGHTHSSWLPSELLDAFRLSRSKANLRPFFFGLNIEGTLLPVCSQDIPIHWLDLEQSYLDAEQNYLAMLSASNGEQPAS